MKRTVIFYLLLAVIIPKAIFAQRAEDGGIKLLQAYEDSLTVLGKRLINDENELERINANTEFTKTLVKALRVNNSFLYPFDSVKAVTITNSPDNRFRILSWHILYKDGSYRFYGAIQLNSGGPLQLFPLADYSPFSKNPEDSVTDNHKWYGAQYYKIIPVYSPKLYYVLLGWKGFTDKSTKKVIDVLSFNNGTPVLGAPVFDGNGKIRKRVIFEYTRQTSMLLRYVPELNLIVFDHLSPPNPKLKSQPETYGPDLSYDGYRLKNGKWTFVENLDMRNVPEGRDDQLADPKKQAQMDHQAAKQANQ